MGNDSIEQNTSLEIIGFEEDLLLSAIEGIKTERELVIKLLSLVDIGCVNPTTFNAFEERLERFFVNGVSFLVNLKKNTTPINDDIKNLFRYKFGSFYLSNKDKNTSESHEILRKLKLQVLTISIGNITKYALLDLQRENSYDNFLQQIKEYRKWYEQAVKNLSIEYRELYSEIANDIEAIFNGNQISENNFLKWLVHEKFGANLTMKFSGKDYAPLGINVMVTEKIEVDLSNIKFTPNLVEDHVFEYCALRRRQIEVKKRRAMTSNSQNMSVNHTKTQISLQSNPWIKYEDIPDAHKDLLEYSINITNKITFEFSNVLPVECLNNDKLRFEWYWERFVGASTKVALYSLKNSSYTNQMNVRAWIKYIEEFINLAESSDFQARKEAQYQKGSPTREVAYLKIVLDVYRLREEAPISITSIEAKVFADCFIILPFLKWKLKNLTKATNEINSESNYDDIPTEQSQSSKEQKKEIYISLENIELIYNALVPYFQGHEARLMQLLEGKAIEGKVRFNESAKVLCNTFNTLYVAGRIGATIEQIKAWLCKYFQANRKPFDLGKGSTLNRYFQEKIEMEGQILLPTIKGLITFNKP